MAAVASFKVLYNIDRDSREYLARYAGQAAVQPAAQQIVTLYDAVLQLSLIHILSTRPDVPVSSRWQRRGVQPRSGAYSPL